MNTQHLETIDSTNSELMRRAAQGDCRPICLVAAQQTAGRGRLGRRWLSEGRGAALTFSLGLPLAPKDWSGLSLAVGLCIAEQLHERIQIKWPNDLWLEGGKLAGILIETAGLPAEPDAPRQLSSSPSTFVSRFCVIGIGINLQAPSASDSSIFKTPPAALHSVMPALTSDSTLQLLLEPLMATITQFSLQGFAPFRKRYEARDALRGMRIELLNPAQDQANPQIVSKGVYAGINDSGALLLQTDFGLQTFTSHEVSVCY
jgi:BirA family transcriptional regulator, biotin operon repressor / biotin---[acetyl-CoA-carboxylase] ligase